jgi:hypothetical protein
MRKKISFADNLRAIAYRQVRSHTDETLLLQEEVFSMLNEHAGLLKNTAKSLVLILRLHKEKILRKGAV